MSIEGKDIQKVEQNVDIETSLQTHGMLMVGLQGAWGGHQGAGHSAGCFVWRWGRGGQRTLQELMILGICPTVLGGTTSSTTRKTSLLFRPRRHVSIWFWPSLTELFHMGPKWAFCLSFPICSGKTKAPAPPGWCHFLKL